MATIVNKKNTLGTGTLKVPTYCMRLQLAVFLRIDNLFFASVSLRRKCDRTKVHRGMNLYTHFNQSHRHNVT